MSLTGVIDTNIVAGLARGRVFEHLRSVYDPLHIPPAVVQEVTGHGQSRPGALELSRALGAWVTETAPPTAGVQAAPASLSLADREVLALALALRVDHLLTGDERLRREAIARGVVCLRATDLVVAFRRLSLIPAVKPVLDRMRQAGFGISRPIYQQALQAAGE